MPVKPVQVSIDTELLRRIDSDSETQKRGRSAFIRSAARLYLAAKKRRDIEVRIHQAYAEKATHMLEEVSELISQQVWPED